MSNEKLSHLIVKGIFSTLQSKWFLLAIMVAVLVYGGWTAHDLATVVGEAIPDLRP